MGSNGYMMVDGIQRIYDGMVDGIQVHKVEAVCQSKSRNLWIYNTVCTDYTWSPLTSTAASAGFVGILVVALRQSGDGSA